MEEQHSHNVRTVRENDEVTLTTTNGHTFRATCVKKHETHAAPESGEVISTSMWTFRSTELSTSIDVAITDGLKSSPEQEDFPRHHKIYGGDSLDQKLGYVESVEIHTPASA